MIRGQQGHFLVGTTAVVDGPGPPEASHSPTGNQSIEHLSSA
jgi:hypothetical protein